MPRIFVDTTPWPLPDLLPKSQEQQDAIPDPMGDIEDIFPCLGILPIPITPETADRVSLALTISEDFITRYPGFTAGERRDDIVSFLRTHDGKGAYLMHY